MRRRALVACAVLAAFGGASARAEETYDPYKIPREQFRAQVAKIALRPLWLPPEIPEPAKIQRDFEQRITAVLKQRGYGVVSFGKRNLDWVLDYVRRQREHHAGGQVQARLEACEATAEAESSPAEAG